MALRCASSRSPDPGRLRGKSWRSQDRWRASQGEAGRGTAQERNNDPTL
ncbi:hypothetical protein G5B35_01330 [Parapusillimonas sp. SGNA-6]|nr:hypothetical protein [Parapusillimonas sp. SGNA-6]